MKDPQGSSYLYVLGSKGVGIFFGFSESNNVVDKYQRTFDPIGFQRIFVNSVISC
jgi:hypothetical protein